MSDELRITDQENIGPGVEAAGAAKRPYTPPASVQLSGGKEEEYGLAIGAVAVWVIGIGPAWLW